MPHLNAAAAAEAFPAEVMEFEDDVDGFDEDIDEFVEVIDVSVDVSDAPAAERMESADAAPPPPHPAIKPQMMASAAMNGRLSGFFMGAAFPYDFS